MAWFADGISDAKLAALDRSQAIVEFASNGTILSANSNFLEIMGYTINEVRGQKHAMFMTPEEREGQDYQNLWDDLRRGTFHAAEFRRIAKGGRDVWIRASYNPILDKHGRVLRIVKLASDITEQKQKSIEATGQIAAINRSQAVIQFTLDGVITDANANFLMTMGYSLDEIVGRHHSLFASSVERESASYAAFWQALKAGEFRAGEFKRYDKQGREVWIYGSYNPILDVSGEPCAVIKFASNITPQVQQREQRAKAQSKIDADLGAITKAMSSVSQQVASTAEAAARTSGNVQAVAAGTEEFSASIEELSRHATEAHNASGQAVRRAEEATVIIGGLTAAADKIGAVVTAIRSIADQTNLLALNATIEAARAGASGRGFAVVANEVKALAAQSSKATEQISAQIAGVQHSTGEAVQAVEAIATTIRQLSEISLSVSSAVTEQAAVTHDMSANMQTAAHNVEQVRQTMRDIVRATCAVDVSVQQVYTTAQALT